MARLMVFYKTPNDTAAFDDYYAATHVPIAQAMPGLRAYDISSGTVAGPDGPTDNHLIATLHFDTLADIKAALSSPEGQAAVTDLGNFADGGVEVMMFDTVDVLGGKG
jgi:uncharacterized protein (TIGR02118 family)